MRDARCEAPRATAGHVTIVPDTRMRVGRDYFPHCLTLRGKGGGGRRGGWNLEQGQENKRGQSNEGRTSRMKTMTGWGQAGTLAHGGVTLTSTAKLPQRRGCGCTEQSRTGKGKRRRKGVVGAATRRGRTSLLARVH